MNCFYSKCAPELKRKLFLTTDTLSKMCGWENITGRFLDTLSELQEALPHEGGPGEENAGDYQM